MYKELDLYNLRINSFIDRYGLVMAKNPNIVGVGCGSKRKNGVDRNIPSLTFLVRKKLSKNDINSRDIIPPLIQGSITDIVEIGEPINYDYNKVYSKATPSNESYYVRPALGGVSIGTEKNLMGGTFGYLVTDIETRKSIYVLSSFTALSNTESKFLGEATYQPASAFSEEFYKNKIGALDTLIPIDVKAKGEGFFRNDSNVANAAISLIGTMDDPQTFKKVSRGFKDGYYIANIQSLGKEKEIIRYGAKGGRRYGKIITTNTTTLVRVFNKDVYFKKQIVADTPHLLGDDGGIGLINKGNTSGPKLLTAFGLATGTYSGDQTMFSDLSTILKLLKVDILLTK